MYQQEPARRRVVAVKQQTRKWVVLGVEVLPTIVAVSIVRRRARVHRALRQVYVRRVHRRAAVLHRRIVPAVAAAVVQVVAAAAVHQVVAVVAAVADNPTKKIFI